jgi:hypothetical protein
VNAGAGVDGFLPVVRQVIDEAADQRVGNEPAGSDAAIDDLRIGWLLHQALDPVALAAAARPLAVDVAVLRENSAGTMASRSLTSSPTRVICCPQSCVAQAVLSGS